MVAENGRPQLPHVTFKTMLWCGKETVGILATRTEPVYKCSNYNKQILRDY